MNKLGSIILIFVVAISISACGNQNGGQKDIRAEKNYTAQQNTILEKAEPLPHLSDSGDRYVQRAYYTQLSDPNKIQYLTLLSLDGSPIAHFTIRGPVGNTSDELTNSSQLYCQANAHAPDGCGVIGQAEPNGVYQGQSDTHIAVTTSGAIIKWQGAFLASDQPFTVKTPAKLVLNENAPITHTDTSHIQNGVVPTRK